MALYVVGMHRSGTSAITEALAALPFDIPDRELLLPGDESNERGYWEVEELMWFNQRLLERQGGSWLAPSTGSIEGMADLSKPELGLDVEALDLMSKWFPGPDWLFKDPRLSITLPFWRRIQTGNSAVLVLRDPRAIARSLRSRDGFAISFGLALWERYMRAAVQSLAGMSVHVVSFSDIADGGKPVLDLVEFAAKSIDAKVPKGIEKSVDTVIDPKLRHHDGGPEIEQLVLTPSQEKLFEALVAVKGTHDNFAFDLGKLKESPGLEVLFESAARFEVAQQAALEHHAHKLNTEFGLQQLEWGEQEIKANERFAELGSEIEDLVRLLNTAREAAHEQATKVREAQVELAQVTAQLEADASEAEFNFLTKAAQTEAESKAELAAAQAEIEHTRDQGEAQLNAVEAALQDQIRHLRHEYDSAIHQRNESATTIHELTTQLALLRGRRGVKVAVKVADGVGRVRSRRR